MTPTRFTVARRLALGFFLVIALGVAIALVGTLRLRGLSGDLQAMSSRQMVQMRQFVQIKDRLNTAALYLRNIMIDPTVERHRFYAGVVEKLRAENVALLDELTPVTDTPRGRELLRAIRDNNEVYDRAVVQATALAVARDIAGADKTLYGAREQRLALFKAVDESIELQYQLAQGVSADGAAAASRGAALMAVLALAMAAAGGLVAWRIAARLLGALGAEPQALSAAAREVADGNLRRPIETRDGDAHSTLAALGQAQRALIGIVGRVRDNAESVATASAEIAQGNADLSQRTEQQAGALQQTAATMDELGATVRHNADSAREASALARGASEVAARGGAEVAEVVTTMQGIQDSSRRIADIIGVIDGIAFQTNILALNAAVEAARAGEQGRGFAVVAGEVRTLAQRSAEAAREIKGLIATSVERVEQGTLLVDRAGHTMGEVVGAIGRVAGLVGDISQASQAQSGGVTQVGAAIAQMDRTTQQNAALVEQSAAAAESLKLQAQALVDAVAFFRLRA